MYHYWCNLLILMITRKNTDDFFMIKHKRRTNLMIISKEYIII